MMKKKIFSLLFGTVILASVNNIKISEVKDRELEEVYGGFYRTKIETGKNQKIILWDEKKILQLNNKNR
ncbi:MAG: hypothetical protein Q9M89_05430 [Persephonella sp.]|nr:hypothetical protein [Persephonella sp.]